MYGVNTSVQIFPPKDLEEIFFLLPFVPQYKFSRQKT